MKSLNSCATSSESGITSTGNLSNRDKGELTEMLKKNEKTTKMRRLSTSTTWPESGISSNLSHRDKGESTIMLKTNETTPCFKIMTDSLKLSTACGVN